MQVWSRSESYVSIIGALTVAVVAGIVISQLTPHAIALALTIPAGLLFYLVNMQKYIRRKIAVSRPFPPAWRSFLQDRVPFYRRLSAEDRLRFEQHTQIFINENRITGVQTTVDDGVRLMVASSAVLLLFGRPEWEYGPLPEILIYPRRFDEDYRFDTSAQRRTIAGQIVPQRAIVLAKDQVLRAFSPDADHPYNVAIHEFAHALDFVEGRASGLPGQLGSRDLRRWRKMIRRELQRVRDGESVLDPYAASNTGELFAVAVEHFFGRPGELKESNRDLYSALASFLHQDPAADR